MQHNWDLYFDTTSEYWERLQKIYEENDRYPKVVMSDRNLHHKFMKSFSRLEGTEIDNDKDNLVSLSMGDHLLVHWLLWKCTKKGYKTRTANAVRLMYRKSLNYLTLETVEMIAKDWVEINHRKMSEESKQKNRASHLGKKFTEEHKNNISKGLKGKPKSEKHKQHLSGKNNGMYGKHHTEETKRKYSEDRKGRKAWNKGLHYITGYKHTEEIKQKISKAHLGKKLSEEHKKKLSNVRKGRHWYNNGKISVFVYECPTGFEIGRLK